MRSKMEFIKIMKIFINKKMFTHFLFSNVRIAYLLFRGPLQIAPCPLLLFKLEDSRSAFMIV
jgi:hypothetical protein